MTPLTMSHRKEQMIRERPNMLLVVDAKIDGEAVYISTLLDELDATRLALSEAAAAREKDTRGMRIRQAQRLACDVMIDRYERMMGGVGVDVSLKILRGERDRVYPDAEQPHDDERMSFTDWLDMMEGKPSPARSPQSPETPE